MAKYSKALRGIQDLIASRTDLETVRVSLIASLLIFCFENLQGEAEAAIRHIKSALNFMRTHLTPSVRYDLKRHSSTSVKGLEDEVSVLLRLNSMFVDSEYMAGKRLVQAEFIERDIDMPRHFQSIE